MSYLYFAGRSVVLTTYRLLAIIASDLGHSGKFSARRGKKAGDAEPIMT
jgi:hypothetical protein